MLKVNRNPRKLAASAALLAIVSVLVVAAHPTTATGSTATETLTFTSRPGTFRFFDVAPKGELPTTGDSLVITNRLFKGGERIGTLHAECVVTRKVANPDNTPMLCQGVYVLDGGTISGTAMLLSNDAVTKIAVTGGTGTYAGASGTATEVTSDNGNKVKVTVTLQ
jgi:hypothetical protein